MTNKQKRPQDMTTEELARKVFPKEVAKDLKRIAHEKDGKPDAKTSSHR